MLLVAWRRVGRTFRPPILYLSKPGEGLAAAELQPSPRSSSLWLFACQFLQFFGSTSYLTPATLAMHAHAEGASLNLSLSPHDSWTSSGMDRWWTAGCLDSSGQVHGERLRPSEVNPNLPSAPDAGHYSSFCLDSVMIKMWQWNGVETHNFFLRGMQFCRSRHVTCEVIEAEVIKNNSMLWIKLRGEYWMENSAAFK